MADGTKLLSFIPLVVLTSNGTQTIPVALASLQGDRMMDVPTINACPLSCSC